MILKVFSIFDNATKAYNQPFFMLTNAEAIRAFQNMALDESTQIFRNPNDFNLYYLGAFDNTEATFKMDMKDLGSAVLFQKKAEDDQVKKLFESKEVKHEVN